MKEVEDTGGRGKPFNFPLKILKMGLTGIAQWVANQKVISLIPSQGTCLGCRPGPRWGVSERKLIDDSSLHFLHPFPSP